MVKTNTILSRHVEPQNAPTFLDVIAHELAKDRADSARDCRFAARRILEDAFRSLEADQPARRCA